MDGKEVRAQCDAFRRRPLTAHCLHAEAERYVYIFRPGNIALGTDSTSCYNIYCALVVTILAWQR